MKARSVVTLLGLAISFALPTYDQQKETVDPQINGSPSYSYRTSAGGADTAVQIALSRRGYYRGPTDGLIGSASEAAIRSFQEDNRLPVTGTVNRSLLQALRVRVPS